MIAENCYLIRDYKYFVEMNSPYKYCNKIEQIFVLRKSSDSYIRQMTPDLCQLQLKVHTVGNTSFRKLIYNNFEIYNKITQNASMYAIANIKEGLNNLQENVQLLYDAM